MRGVCRWMAGGYAAVGAGLAAVYAKKASWYLMAQSLGTIAALAAVFAVMKLLGARPVYTMHAVVTAFMFGSYTLGVACEFYKIVPGFDKLMHMLSGTLTMMLALPLFYAAKSGRRIERSDCALAVLFCVMTALAVAGVWEMAEYALGLVTELDPQCAQATGVSDTMQDMIVCTLGALAGVPSLIRFYRTGRGGILYSPAEAYVRLNLTPGRV